MSSAFMNFIALTFGKATTRQTLLQRTFCCNVNGSYPVATYKPTSPLQSNPWKYTYPCVERENPEKNSSKLVS